MENQTQKTNGALIGSIVIIVILMIGGIYLVREKMANDQRAENARILQEQQQANAEKLSNSDDMSAIEADLNANSDMDSLDEDLN